MAVANYHDAYGAFPPAYVADADGKPMHSWRVLLLPYVEARELYGQYDFNEPWDGPHNIKLVDKRPTVYAFHDSESRAGTTTTNYLAVVGAETVWPGGKSFSMDQLGDGADQTILIVENHGSGIPWTAPRDLDFATMSMDVGAASPNGVSSRFEPPAVVTASRRVHTVSMRLLPKTLKALLTANGGEKLSVDAQFNEIPDGRLRPLKAKE